MDNDDRRGSLSFDEKLWGAADLLRKKVDPADYKHVVLGLLFLKYTSAESLVEAAS
jgi:type I restriction enzyme M protein